MNKRSRLGSKCIFVTEIIAFFVPVGSVKIYFAPCSNFEQMRKMTDLRLIGCIYQTAVLLCFLSEKNAEKCASMVCRKNFCKLHFICSSDSQSMLV